MRDYLRALTGIDDDSLDSIIEEYNNKHISIDGLLYYIKYKYNMDDIALAEIEKQLSTGYSPPALEASPLISVIIPTYNRKDMLKNCLGSVLAQEYDNIEIIIIDDCSTDGTPDLIRDYCRNKNIIYIRNDVHKNAGHNRHLGYNTASGEFIIFLDDDDFYLDRYYFSKAVSKHLEMKELAFVCANTLVEDRLQNTLYIRKANISGVIDAKEYLMNFKGKYSKPDSTLTAVFKRDALDQADFKNMTMMDDSVIYMRALLYGKEIFFSEDIVGVYRIHGGNLTKKLPNTFIIGNLEGIKWLYEKMKPMELNFDICNWILRQYMSTVGYYIMKSKPSFYSVLKLLIWSLKNDSKLRYRLFGRILRFYVRSKRS